MFLFSIMLACCHILSNNKQRVSETDGIVIYSAALDRNFKLTWMTSKDHQSFNNSSSGGHEFMATIIIRHYH